MNPQQAEFDFQTDQEILRSRAAERIEAVKVIVNDENELPLFFREPIKEERERSVTEHVFSERVLTSNAISSIVNLADNAKGFDARVSAIRKLKTASEKFFSRAEHESRKIEQLLSKLNDRGDTYNPELMDSDLLKDSEEGHMDTFTILVRSAASFDAKYSEDNPNESEEQGVADYLKTLSGESGVEISVDDKNTITQLVIVAANNLSKRVEFWRERHDVLDNMHALHLGKAAVITEARIKSAEKNMSEDLKDHRDIVDNTLRY